MVVQLAEERDVDVAERVGVDEEAAEVDDVAGRVETDEETAEVVDVAGRVAVDEEAAEVDTTDLALLEVVLAVLELIGLDGDEATFEVLAMADEELALLYGDGKIVTV
ncbi:hypothetical protein LTR56_024241 [Elasticomyces elasticus]|nr:hypothetical protein LTR56_024241 [Elasticomyces elasticus]KAK3625340.1 hypothetical protein LTR22_023595 [Elasticomyces elasticus]KAK5756460.1 hypothetical protein LTS12_013414 [Elasticomyces elasticus]